MRALFAGLAGTFWLAVALIAGVSAYATIHSNAPDAAPIGRLPDTAGVLQSRLVRELKTALEAGAPPPDDTSIKLMRAAPLSPWPLIAQAVAQAQAGAPGEAAATMDAAYHRDPRNLVAIGWLANQAGEAGRAGDALLWLDRFLAVNPRVAGDVRAIAAGYAADPGAQEALEALLRADRGWARALLGELNRTSQDLPLLLDLNRVAPDQQGVLLERVLKERGVEVAFLAWLSLARDGALTSLEWPVDHAFNGADAPLPFNWRLTNDQAELIEGGGLYTTFFGRGRPTLARQVMMLGPGRYQLTAIMSGEVADAGGAFEWEVGCLNASDTLGRVKAASLGSARSQIGFEFEVPGQGCSGQQLTLRGAPGEFPIRARATTWSVDIVEARP